MFDVLRIKPTTSQHVFSQSLSRNNSLSHKFNNISVAYPSQCLLVFCCTMYIEPFLNHHRSFPKNHQCHFLLAMGVFLERNPRRSSTKDSFPLVSFPPDSPSHMICPVRVKQLTVRQGNRMGLYNSSSSWMGDGGNLGSDLV